MISGPDIVVYSPDHNLLLVVEIKGTPKSDECWAAKLRRNLVAHGAIPSAPYFLLVVSDHLYLWKNEISSEAVLPSYSADTKTVLNKYLPRWKNTSEHGTVSERGLELAVRSWLSELTTRDDLASVDESNAWLQGSGLQEKIRAGEVGAECQA